ncbi:DUF862-domain-containing protein [Serendipita vermifera]|nr:DUF862-domain-containing protein [Serendipita vermifera]
MAPVKLYVYDLSQGMAARLSQQLTGRYIEGVWHTSIVFHGKEFWYGRGIESSTPGASRAGQPLKIVDLGESEIDQETFLQYIEEMRYEYTPDKYHLLDFNCNSFTNDCAGFLTGGSIPAYIKDLPADFLSTPLGAALRPTIDQMFRGPDATPPVPPQNALASNILQQVSANATGSTSTVTSPANTLVAPIQICTNVASFNTVLERHKAAVAFFTSQTCPPCRMIEPTFEELACSKASPEVAFIKVDLGVGMGHQVGQQHNVYATPTFIFFLNGKRTGEIKGANAPELRSQINLLIFDAFPPHLHSKLPLPLLRGTDLKPILFQQVPKLDALSTKLLSIIDSLEVPAPQKATWKSNVSTMKSYIGERLPNKTSTTTPANISEWVNTTAELSKLITPASIFPLIDLWRLALLLPDVTSHLCSTTISPIPALLKIAAEAPNGSENKNLHITTLKLACNIFANSTLVRLVLSRSSPQGAEAREALTLLLVNNLLSELENVREAAASLAFNIATFLQKPLMEALERGMTGQMPKDEIVDDWDWRIELLSAVIEAIGREKSEGTLHRLVMCLGLLIHLSPQLDELKDYLQAMQVKETLQQRLNQKDTLGNDKVKKLVKELSDNLC